MLAILTAYMETKPGLRISRKDCKHMVGNVYFKMYGYGLLSLALEWSQVLIFHKKLFQSIFWQL